MKQTPFIKVAFVILPLFLSLGCEKQAHKQQEYNIESREVLDLVFSSWKKAYIESGNMWAADSCYMGWFNEHENDDEGLPRGFPKDEADYHYSYADLNADNTNDVMITFTPVQCDGGNASMWTQMAVFIISDGEGYYLNPVINEGVLNSIGTDSPGFYHYDSIGVNKVYATYIEFKEDDGHCCPSIKKPVVIDSKNLDLKGPDKLKAYGY